MLQEERGRKQSLLSRKPVIITVVWHGIRFRLKKVEWDWLRTNASGMPNTCKSNAKGDFGL